LKRKGNSIAFSIVILVIGFLLSFSYSLTKDQFLQNDQSSVLPNRFEAQEEKVRKELVMIQEANLKLSDELFNKQSVVREFEENLAVEEDLTSLANQAELLRLILGKVPVSGQGVIVTLEDGQYDPSILNINEYLVHEHHVFKVINELYIAGAEAISINGQRIRHNSYIVCNGPVITVDGVQYPAPFTISAIGNSATMASALTITGGIRDQLVNDHINFTLDKNSNIAITSVLGDQ